MRQIHPSLACSNQWAQACTSHRSRSSYCYWWRRRLLQRHSPQGHTKSYSLLLVSPSGASSWTGCHQLAAQWSHSIHTTFATEAGLLSHLSLCWSRRPPRFRFQSLTWKPHDFLIPNDFKLNSSFCILRPQITTRYCFKNLPLLWLETLYFYWN